MENPIKRRMQRSVGSANPPASRPTSTTYEDMDDRKLDKVKELLNSTLSENGKGGKQVLQYRRRGYTFVKPDDDENTETISTSSSTFVSDYPRSTNFLLRNHTSDYIAMRTDKNASSRTARMKTKSRDDADNEGQGRNKVSSELKRTANNISTKPRGVKSQNKTIRESKTGTVDSGFDPSLIPATQDTVHSVTHVDGTGCTLMRSPFRESDILQVDKDDSVTLPPLGIMTHLVTQGCGPGDRQDKGRRSGADGDINTQRKTSYDACNTSTQLILLNNNYGKNTHLWKRARPASEGTRPATRIDPQRHHREASFYVSGQFHGSCTDSRTPERFRSSSKLALLLDTDRPSSEKIGDRLHEVRANINPRRHRRCLRRKRCPNNGMDFSAPKMTSARDHVFEWQRIYLQGPYLPRRAKSLKPTVTH